MMIILGILATALAAVFSIRFSDLLWNNSKKRRLLDEFASAGQDATGIIIKVVRVRNVHEAAGHVYSIQYTFPGENCLVTKPLIRMPSCPTTRLVRLKVLSEHPNSAYPRVLVDNRENIFASDNIILMANCLLLAQLLLSSLASVFFLLDGTGFLLLSAGLFLMGYLVSRVQYRLWENEVLRTNVNVASESRGGRVSASTRRQRDGSYSSVPMGDAESEARAALEEHGISLDLELVDVVDGTRNTRTIPFEELRNDFSRQGPGPTPSTEPLSGPPPASEQAIRRLPVIQVTPQDLVDPTNRECCICLEKLPVRTKALRLPCAHIFHIPCALEWLRHRCTCPACRYELPTDHAVYEQDRMERMRHRKPRFSRHELDRLGVKELKALLLPRYRHLPVADKTDLIERLIETESVDFITAPKPVSYRMSELKAMSISRLKACMNEEAGVFFDPLDVIEKDDMLRIFYASGRLDIIAEETEGISSIIESTTVDPLMVETVDSDDEDDRGITASGRVDTRSDPSRLMEDALADMV